MKINCMPQKCTKKFKFCNILCFKYQLLVGDKKEMVNAKLIGSNYTFSSTPVFPFSLVPILKSSFLVFGLLCFYSSTFKILGNCLVLSGNLVTEICIRSFYFSTLLLSNLTFDLIFILIFLKFMMNDY